MLPTCFGKGGGGSRVNPMPSCYTYLTTVCIRRAPSSPTCLGRGGGGGTYAHVGVVCTVLSLTIG